MPERSKLLLGLALVVVAGFGPFACRGQFGSSLGSETAKSNDHVSRMSRYSMEGRFDEAFAEGQLALKDRPGNTAIIGQIAMVCLLHAQKISTDREHWISKGTEYAHEMADQSVDSDPITISNAVQAGKILKFAGDLSTDKCKYYIEGINVIESHGSGLREDDIVVGGKLVSTASLLGQRAKTLADLQKKATDMNCRK